MAHAQFDVELLNSPSLMKLPEKERPYFLWDILASGFDAFGCFPYSPARIVGNLAEILPGQRIGNITKRLRLYKEEGILEVWDCDTRTYGHWVAWFRPKRGGKGRLNSYPTNPKVTRQTPIPPSLLPWNGDARQVEDWQEVTLSVMGTDLLRIAYGLGTDTTTTTNTTTTTTTNTTTPAAPEGVSDFDSLWKAWPKKVARSTAQRTWDRICKRPEWKVEIIRKAALRFAASQESVEPQYRVRLSAWLNDGRWEDEPDTPQAAPAPPPRAQFKEYQPPVVESGTTLSAESRAAIDDLKSRLQTESKAPGSDSQATTDGETTTEKGDGEL